MHVVTYQENFAQKQCKNRRSRRQTNYCCRIPKLQKPIKQLLKISATNLQKQERQKQKPPGKTENTQLRDPVVLLQPKKTSEKNKNLRKKGRTF